MKIKYIKILKIVDLGSNLEQEEEYINSIIRKEIEKKDTGTIVCECVDIQVFWEDMKVVLMFEVIYPR